MTSTNGSGRQSGFVSIPVEIIRDSNPNNTSGSHSRHNSPYRTLHNDSPFGGFSDSPPWSPQSTNRFQRRQSPTAAYDRVITNSHFNQPSNDHSSYQQHQEPQYRQSQQQQEPQYRQSQQHQEPQYRQPQQRMYEPSPSNYSRSSEDLLSSPFDSTRYSTQMPYSSLIPPSFGGGFRTDSDFVHPSKFSSPLRRSYDALNDFADMRQSFPTTRQHPSEQQRQQEQQQPYYRSSYQTQPQSQQQQQQPSYANQTYINPNIVYTNEYGDPTDHYQPNTFQGTRNSASNDRSRSPTSQRGASPAPPSSSTSQLQEEPELKMAKDSDGPIPMPAPASASSSPPPPPAPLSDQQVPSTDTSASTNAASPPPEPVRDPNTIALEKLEQIKQTLDMLEKEVDIFTGSTRNERSYKLLDEQGLKIMIRCDELVDVSPDIKEKRKEMIRNVERVINKLESKVPATPATESNSNPMVTVTTSTDNSVANNNEEKSSSSSSPPKEDISASKTTTKTEQSAST